VKISLARIITKRDRELFEMSRAVIADSRWNGGQQAGAHSNRGAARNFRPATSDCGPDCKPLIVKTFLTFCFNFPRGFV
jgi:hypothetical protein